MLMQEEKEEREGNNYPYLLCHLDSQLGWTRTVLSRSLAGRRAAEDNVTKIRGNLIIPYKSYMQKKYHQALDVIFDSF